MPSRADPENLALALEERLGGNPGQAFQGRLTVFLESGQRAEAAFRDPATVVLTAPVEGAHDGLPDSILRGLLAANAFGGPLSGGILRVRNGGDTLEIADHVPTELGVATIANLMINQAGAASALAGRIATEVAESLASEQSAVGG